MKKAISVGVSIVVVALAIWYITGSIKPDEWVLIAGDFTNLDVSFVMLALAISMMSHITRAERYRTILRPMHPHLSFMASFNAVMIGYAFNTILPRAGEVVRPVVFAKREGIPTEEAIGAILIERILDVVSIMMALILVMTTSGDTLARIFAYYGSTSADSAPIETQAILSNLSLALVGLLAFVGMLVFTRLGQVFSERVVGRLHKRIGDALSRIITKIADGLRVIKKPRLYIRLFIETVLVWATYCFVSFFIIKAMPYPSAACVTIGQASIILVVIGLGVTVAPTPGALGIYQIIAQASLVAVCGATPVQGFVFGMISWIVNYGLVLLGGFICWLSETADTRPSMRNSSSSM